MLGMVGYGVGIHDLQKIDTCIFDKVYRYFQAGYNGCRDLYDGCRDMDNV